MKKITGSVSRAHMQGFSLVEVMVSLVIGLVVVGAVLVSYIGSGQTNKRQAAYAEMNENAQIALSMMRNDLLLAGYAQPTSAPAGASLSRTFALKPVFGCDNGFASPSQTGTLNAAGCAASGTPAIEMSYEADVTNTVPTSAGIPSDCLGNGLNVKAAGAITYYVTNNRYYLTAGSTGRSELHCASSRTPMLGGQPLVDNVENMQVWYGEANTVSPRQIVRYVSAGNVSDWQNIISVRICLLMRSANPVLSNEGITDTDSAKVAATAAALNGYLDCSSNPQTSADRYLRRAYFSTTTLRNKMTF